MANEKRLIDANAFLEKMKRTSRYFDVVFDVEEMPTVDAVEVVRCKDCVSHNICKFEQFQGLNGFCSYGERKCNATD